MKLLLAASLLLSGPSIGQGVFRLTNRALGEIDAPFLVINPRLGECIGPAGGGWTVEMLGGPVGTSPDKLVSPSPSSTRFQTGANAGYVESVESRFDSLGPGTDIELILRVFNGPDFYHSSSRASAGPFEFRLAGSGGALPTLVPLGKLPIDLCVPEPRIEQLFGIVLLCFLLPSADKTV